MKLRHLFFLFRIAFILGFIITPLCWAADETRYFEAGMPTTDHVWLGDDYSRAADVLSVGRADLPMYADSAGRAVLKRFTSLENLSFYRSKTTPLSYRTEDYTKLVNAIDIFIMLYITAANKGKDVHKETAKILAFMLYSAAAGVELTDELIPTVPKDEQYSVTMNNIKNMRSSAMAMFAGAEGSLSKRDFYSDEDLSELLDAMISVFPVIRKVLTDTYRKELSAKLKIHQGNFRNVDLQNIEKIQALLGQ